MKNFCLLILLLVGGLAAQGSDLYVSTSGLDSNPGTATLPLASLAGAQSRIAAIKAASGLPDGGINVWLTQGYYRLSASAQFAAADSGSASAPITYSALPGAEVHLTGSVSLDPTWFSLVTDSSPVWGRLDAAARGKVYQVDLGAHGISDFGTMKVRGFGLRATAPMELFANGLPMTLARWPNEGAALAQIASVASATQFTLAGSRAARWATAPDMWMHGLWGQDWADYHLPVSQVIAASSTVTLGSAPPQYGITNLQPLYVYNLLEELDTPGEYYLDRTTGLLYVWPSAPVAESVFLVSMLENSLLNLQGASFIRFQNLVMEGSRGALVTLSACNNVTFTSCVFRNCGQYAVALDGTNCGISQSLIDWCGEEGVRITGGDRPSLTHANNFVTSSRFHGTGRIDWTYKPGISLEGGCGNSATYNLLDAMPHAAVLFSGNDHHIAFNEIWHVCQMTSDAGAIYSGRDWSSRGNVIQSNFLHDISTALGTSDVNGVYLDDCMSGVTVSANVFSGVTGTAIFCGGGRDNLIQNNVIAQSGTAHYNDDRGRTDINGTPGDPWNLLAGLTAGGIQYQQGIWAATYPACAAIPNQWSDVQQGLWRNPQGSVFSSNYGWGNLGWTFENNSSGTGVFAVYASMVGNVSAGASLFDPVSVADRSQRPALLSPPGLASIPFSSIGPISSTQPAGTIAPSAAALMIRTVSDSAVELDWFDTGSLWSQRSLGFEVQQQNSSDGSWIAIKECGPDVDFLAVSQLSAATATSFRIRSYNAAGSAYSPTVTTVTAAAPVTLGTGVRFEAETPLTVLQDIGSNGNVGVSKGTLDSGAGSVRMYDPGDTIQITISVPADGNYQLGLGVRSGGSTGPTSLWPNGYTITLDGAATPITGDAASLSALDPSYGGCYWGQMNSASVFLQTGPHLVTVTSHLSWEVVDYLEVTPTSIQPVTGGTTATTTSGSTDDPTTPTTVVTPTEPASGGSTPSTPSSPSAPASPSTAVGLFSGDVDIGSVSSAGNTSETNGVYSVTAEGPDIWNGTVGFHYAFQAVTGDFSATVRVASLQNSDSWAKAGIMIRTGVLPGDAFAGLYLTPGNGLAFQWSATAGNTTDGSIDTGGAAPGWLRLVRSGDLISAYSSSDGTSWTAVGTATIKSISTMNVGLAVTSHSTTQPCTATFDSVAITPTTQAQLTDADIGTVAVAGKAAAQNGTVVLTGSGPDIWNSDIGFNYDYERVSGDFSITARVSSVQAIDPWTKAGLIIRQNLSANDAFAAVFVTPNNGIVFQWCPGAGITEGSFGVSGAAPAWIRLVRSGSTFTAYASADGSAWATVGSATFAMTPAAVAGLAVTSHNAATSATATFDSISMPTAAP